MNQRRIRTKKDQDIHGYRCVYTNFERAFPKIYDHGFVVLGQAGVIFIESEQNAGDRCFCNKANGKLSKIVADSRQFRDFLFI